MSRLEEGGVLALLAALTLLGAALWAREGLALYALEAFSLCL